MASGFSFGSVFGRGSVFEQLFVWQVLAQFISAVGAPGLEALTQLVNSHAPVTALSVADAVDAVVKGHVSHDQGAAEASLSGISRERFDVLLAAAGEPPGLMQLLEAYRRGVIPKGGAGASSTSLEQGIRESRLHDKWIPVVEALGLVPIGVADAVDAVVEGQIGYDQGEHIAYLNGVDAANFRILVNTRGNPPSPSELVELHRRGLIPLHGTGPDVLSVQQGIFEGATKDKWEPMFEALTEALPPPRTVTALLRNGAIDDAKALSLFQQAGLSAEIAAAYVTDAHHQRTAAARELAKGDIETLYRDQAVGRDAAADMLRHLGYSAEDADFLLAMQDFHRTQGLVTQAIGKVRSVYVARKIGRQAALNALNTLKVPPGQVDQLIQTWDLEVALSVKVPTAAEIADAFHWQIIDQDTASSMLVDLGYTAHDAWLLLSVRAHKSLPGEPPG